MTMRKKVAVSTYCVWTSYGSILQSYALKQVLSRLGYDSYIIIDEPEINPYSFTSIKNGCGLKGLFVSGYMRLNRKKIISRYNKNTDFINKHIDLIEYKDYQDLLHNAPCADFYLSGSDQVFNPLKNSPAFFLDFVKDKTLCYSYACSMGETKIPLKNEDEFSRLINNFKTISCREDDNIPILKKYNPNAQYFCHIDPTFLLAPDEWKKIMIPYEKSKKQYILVFPIYWDNRINEKLRTLHETTGIEIVAICTGFSKVYANKRLMDVSVGEFLWLIDHAEGVVSSSFHGVALSLVLNKKLATVVNPSLPSRISCLLEKLDAKPLDIENLISGKMNYDVINNNILKEKAKGEEYLGVIFGE